MRTVSEIIAHCDHVISVVPGSCILSDEDWQTLKAAVLAQQSTNSAMVQCQSHACYMCCPVGDEYCPKEPCLIQRAQHQ